jgi:transposase
MTGADGSPRPPRPSDRGRAWRHARVFPSRTVARGRALHQQGWDARVALPAGLVAGIDVPADRLDMATLSAEHRPRVGNDAAGRAGPSGARTLGRLATATDWAEAGGWYERGVGRRLLAAGLPARRVNPHRLRHLARALGVLAKNDRPDAEVIARSVASVPTGPAVRAPAAGRLAELVTARRQLCDELVTVENRALRVEDAVLRRLARRRAARPRADILTSGLRVAGAVAAGHRFAARSRLPRSVQGVGPVIAGTLPDLLPELGGFARMRAAALVGGLAPLDPESGKHKGARSMWDGHAAMRHALPLHGGAPPGLQRPPARRRQAAQGRPHGGHAQARPILEAVLRGGSEWDHDTP